MLRETIKVFVSYCRDESVPGSAAQLPEILGFPECSTPEETNELLKLYKLLVTFPDFSENDLYTAQTDEKLDIYIADTFSNNNQKHTEQYIWFRNHTHLFRQRAAGDDPNYNSESDDDYVPCEEDSTSTSGSESFGSESSSGSLASAITLSESDQYSEEEETDFSEEGSSD